MYQNIKRNFIKLISLLFTLNIAKFFKLTFILGSRVAFFSFSQAIAPISGLLFDRKLNLFTFFSRIILSVFTGFNLFFILLYHIPTFCASVYLNSKSNLAKISIPFISIILFLSNPNIIKSNLAIKLYCLYFTVPIIITFLRTKSIFLNCLASTFVAHSVGTILWLYTHKFNELIYYKLISIVWAERLLFALIMTSAFYTIKLVNNLLKDKINLYLFNIKSMF